MKLARSTTITAAAAMRRRKLLYVIESWRCVTRFHGMV
jgi:hypothetical protein